MTSPGKACGISLTFTRHIKGPKTDPCGTL